MDEMVLTPEQVSQILQVHPFTVLKFIKQGKLKASKLGRVYRIRRGDVDLFLDEQAKDSEAAMARRQAAKEQAVAPTKVFEEAPSGEAKIRKIKITKKVPTESIEEVTTQFDATTLDEAKATTLKTELPVQGTTEPGAGEKTDFDHYIIEFKQNT